MQFKELDKFKLDDAIHFHDHLNPAVFKGDHLRDDVRQKLLLIAEDFVEHLGINDLDIADITISGSNAAYTYTAHSDIDLHILVDIKGFEDDDVYRELFDAKKTVYNEQHDIKINGYEVEVYVQDSNEPVISLGEYSVMNDKWIKLPRKRKADFDQMATKLKYRKLYRLSKYALQANTPDKIQNVLKTLKKYRQAGLDKLGEFSPENLAFKALRSKGVIQKLYDKLNDLHSETLSIPESENLDKRTLNIDDLARKHRVSKDYLLDQLMKGIGIESEHTSNFDIAAEIALDHLGENPNYYELLKKANLEEDATSLPSIIYHVTPTRNLRSIMSRGLTPQVGDRSSQISGEQSAIYCFPSKVAVEDAMMNWLGDEFDEGEQLALLAINTQGLEGSYTPNAEYEIAVTSVIPPSNIKILAKDLDNYSLSETATLEECGYIPSESERNDPRFKTALTVDITPNSIKDNANRLGSKVQRDGRPPLLRP